MKNLKNLLLYIQKKKKKETIKWAEDLINSLDLQGVK